MQVDKLADDRDDNTAAGSASFPDRGGGNNYHHRRAEKNSIRTPFFPLSLCSRATTTKGRPTKNTSVAMLMTAT